MKPMLSRSVLLVLVGVLTYSCSNKEAAVEEVKDESQLITTAHTSLEDVDQDYLFTATIEPFKRNAISPSQPNRIRKIYVEVGDWVTKNMLLAEMDETNVNQQRMQIANYEKDLSRVKELVAVGGASTQQLDQLAVQVDVAHESLKLMMENSKLLSPIDGVITARNYDEGDMTSTQAVLVVMQIRPVKLLIHVSEQSFKAIKMGMSVKVKTDVYGDEEFAGKVSMIHPTIDETSRTFGVQVTIPNADQRIRPGMFARVNLNLGTQRRVVVPDLAVIRQPGSDERYVFVIENNVAHYRSIEVGRRLNDRYEVLSGLEGNETVAVSGAIKLVDGKTVRVK